MQNSRDSDTMAMPPEEQARADLYALLGALLAAPPNQQLLGLLRDITVQDNTEKGIMTPAWHELRLAAHNATAESLNDEYQKLFIGVGRGELLPYASWYKTGFLMDKPLATLRADLTRLGYSLKDDVSEPEDHAAALCETMGAIISDNHLSLETQKAFYHEHLASWMERFFSDLATAKSAQFYKSVGELGRLFMQLEGKCYSMAL